MTNHKNKNLTPTAFSILLALSLKPRHGYEIMEQVKSDSNDRIVIGPGALYGTIKDLNKLKYIKELDDNSESQRKRRYYTITEQGSQALEGELAYFNRVLKLAEVRKLKMNDAKGL